jgi:hypothetical protein
MALKMGAAAIRACPVTCADPEDYRKRCLPYPAYPMLNDIREC